MMAVSSSVCSNALYNIVNDQSGLQDANNINNNMKSVRRLSLCHDFEVYEGDPVPDVPTGGVRVKVYYAGACFTDQHIQNAGRKGLRYPGVRDTSLFQGYEVAGIVDFICETVAGDKFEQGDRVIVYPDEEENTELGYSEYIIVRDMSNLLKIRVTIPMELACLLPCGALRAYAAINKAKPFVLEKMKSGSAHVLIVGAGGLGLWTLKLAKHFLEDNQTNVRVSVADNNADKLMVAKDHGCYDVVHWDESLHEEYILDRTENVCPGGIDVIIDFVSSPRSVRRCMKVLKEGGLLLVGGNSKHEISVLPNSLANKNQSLLGVGRGTREQLEELVKKCEDGELTAPSYTVYPVEQANHVFRLLSQSELNGRAVLRLNSEDEELEDDCFSS